MPRIIATDEAGYGPRLGPLVVAASIWDVEGNGVPAAERVATAIGDGIALSDGALLAIGDSKLLFKRNTPAGITPLEQAVAAFVCLSHPSAVGAADNPLQRVPSTLADLVALVAPHDLATLLEQPWFGRLEAPFPLCDRVEQRTAAAAGEILQALCRSGIEYVSSAARILDSKDFNSLCVRMGNKATVLSETTVELVRHWAGHPIPDGRLEVFSDRHGGRHHYASLLQKYFPDALPQILREDAAESHYRIRHDGIEIDWRFTVKGDRFAPVALASMFAKYLRERLMEQVNAFWASHHGKPLAPTAGYSTDATRFCKEIATTARRLGIARDHYIRAR